MTQKNSTVYQPDLMIELTELAQKAHAILNRFGGHYTDIEIHVSSHAAYAKVMPSVTNYGEHKILLNSKTVRGEH